MDAIDYNQYANGKIWNPLDLPHGLRRLCFAGDDASFQAWVELYQALHGLMIDGKLGPNTFQHMTSTSWLDNVVLKGKGMWLHRLGDHLPGVAQAVKRMQAAGIKHVLYKMADGTGAYNKSSDIEQLLSCCRNYGIVAAPWVFAYSYNDEDGGDRTLLRQIAEHTRLALKYDAPCFVINAEHGFLKKRRRKDQNGKTYYVKHPNWERHAELYCMEMRKLGVPLYVSSYGKANHQFPYDEFCAGADIVAPQIYTGPHNRDKDPVTFFNECVRNWARHASCIPITPSLGNYQSRSSTNSPFRKWHTGKSIRALISHCNEFRVAATTLWLYLPVDYKKNKGRSRVTRSQWDALAGVPWWF